MLMSNETETMKKKSKRRLTPKLRFPEFRDAPGWEAQPLDIVSYFVKKKIPLHQLNLDTYVSTENLSPNYGGIEQASKLPPNGSATEYKPDDILIANIRPYLKKVWRSNRSGGASNDVIVIRPKAVLQKDYLPMVIANDTFINFVMKTAKGVKMPRGDIASMKGYIVHYPTPAEQQKIADCLSSLDGLITAEGRMLAALKAHKKGLMQQLFPQPGQTQPRLRFPEFRDQGEWENKTLGEVADYENGKAHEQDIDEYGKYIVVNSRFISTAGEVIKYSNSINLDANKDDILMVLSDVPNGRAIARCFLVDEDDKYTVNQRICKITAKSAVSELLCYILDRNTYFLSFDDGVKQTNLKKEDVLQCPIMLPKDEDEQQRIADCFTALDSLIAAQAAKIETLKQHKCGLMQQLFPSPQEVET